MPLNQHEKDELYQDYQIPITNMIRMIERQAVNGDSHRLIEVTANCLHGVLNALRVRLDVHFVEADVEASVYGENGGGK